MRELPRGWRLSTLGESASLITKGTTPTTNGFSFKVTGINFIKVENTIGGQIRPETIVDFISPEAHHAQQRSRLEANDILFSIAGTIGSVCVVKTEHLPANTNQAFAIIRGTEKTLRPDLLAYQLKAFVAAIKSKARGGAMNNVSLTDLKQMALVAPPLSEQVRIVAKLDELFSDLDAGVASLNQARAQLKVYRQAVLKRAFEGRLVGGKEEEIHRGGAEDAEGRGGLPEVWRWERLGELADIRGGVTKGRNLEGMATIEVPYLRVANVQDGYLALDHMKTIQVLPSDVDKFRLQHGDVLYTEGGDRDKLGRGTVWRDEVKNCIHQNHVFRARPNTLLIDSAFLSYFSQTKVAKAFFFENGKQTTNLASINLTILSTLPIPLPPLAEQHAIVAEIERRFSVADALEATIDQSLKQAEALRQSLLQKAFRGELVPQDP